MAKPQSGESLESQGTAVAGGGLTDSWKQHMKSRSFAPEPYHLHRLAVLAYFYCLLAVPAVFVVRVLPGLFLSEEAWWLAILTAGFFVVENFLNYRACLLGHHDCNIVHCFHCQRTNPDVLAWQRRGPSEREAGHRCLACQTESPPRSRHCRLCNLCVMRRHFHCYLLCCCIGHRTHGHFLVLCLYSVLGLSAGSFAFAIYTVKFGDWSCLLLPVALASWAVGSVDVALPVVVFSLYAQLACLCAAAIYGCLQLLLLLRNQTPSEMAALDRHYRLDSCYDNLRVSLGSARAWPLLLLYPVRLRPDSDGCSWQLRSKRS